MGNQIVTEDNKEIHASFTRALLDDIKALEIMLEEKIIEDNITRIGAEQEFCLVNENWRPANNSMHLLKLIDDPHFTTELAKYNLEINLDPFELRTDAFSKMEKQLEDLILKARKVCKNENTRIILTGILPTISMNELEYEYITPMPRYQLMNKLLKEKRGDDFRLQIKGVDELSLKHDSVLFEACNTSFQMHLQVSPEDFTSSYNWCQAISAPVYVFK